MPSRRGAGSARRVGVRPTDGGDAAAEAEDTLDEDEAVVSAFRDRARWRKYVENFRHFIEDAIEGWRMEGRTFPSQRAKREAIGRLVTGTRAEVRKDPEMWVREHCDRG
jgi:hypothetical protein